MAPDRIYKLLTFAALFACSGVNSGWAYEQAPYTVTADVTWASKYMTDGFDVAGGDHPVLQPSLTMTTPVSGLSAMIWSSIQTDRNYQSYDEIDFFGRYSHDLFERTPYALNFHGFVDYWMFPRSQTPVTHADGSTSMESSHGTKLNAGVSATNLIPVLDSHLVPTYNAYYWIYWQNNLRDQYQGGTRHQFELEYYHQIPRFIPGATYQYAGVVGDLNYNDGVFGVTPGWSHSTAQFSAGVYALGCIFSLSVNRQWSYQPSVDSKNELWSTLSFTKVF